MRALKVRQRVRKKRKLLVMRWVAVLLKINNLKPNEKPGGFSGGCAALTGFSEAIFGTIAENVGHLPKVSYFQKAWSKNKHIILTLQQTRCSMDWRLNPCRLQSRDQGANVFVVDRLLPPPSQGCPHSQRCKPTSATLRTFQGTSLVVQWLRLRTCNAGSQGSIPGWGARSTSRN